MFHKYAPQPFQFSSNTQSWQCRQIFVLIKFESKLDVVISHINLISKHHVTSPNLFPLEVVQKYQHCQLCGLKEKLGSFSKKIGSSIFF